MPGARQICLGHLRLHLIGVYNLGMGMVDIADQLRLQYHVDRFIHNKSGGHHFSLEAQDQQ